MSGCPDERNHQGKPVIAEDCGRHIHVEQPLLVIEAICEVVEAVRAEN